MCYHPFTNPTTISKTGPHKYTPYNGNVVMLLPYQNDLVGFYGFKDYIPKGLHSECLPSSISTISTGSDKVREGQSHPSHRTPCPSVPHKPEQSLQQPYIQMLISGATSSKKLSLHSQFIWIPALWILTYNFLPKSSLYQSLSFIGLLHYTNNGP